MECFPLNDKIDIRVYAHVRLRARARALENLRGIGVVDFLIECTEYANVKRWKISFGDDDGCEQASNSCEKDWLDRICQTQYKRLLVLCSAKILTINFLC